MNILRFLDAIRGQITTTLAVSTRIGKQNRVTMFEQQTAVPCHAFTIVSDSMQQDHRIAVVVMWVDKPTLEFNSICGSNGHILQISAEISSHGCSNGLLMAQRKPMEFEAEVGNYNSSQN